MSTGRICPCLQESDKVLLLEPRLEFDDGDIDDRVDHDAIEKKNRHANPTRHEGNQTIISIDADATASRDRLDTLA
jgi:hypothetical protein